MLVQIGVLIFIFFSSRRRHTRCLSDWSSDVCSSDLHALPLPCRLVSRLRGFPQLLHPRFPGYPRSTAPRRTPRQPAAASRLRTVSATLASTLSHSRADSSAACADFLNSCTCVSQATRVPPPPGAPPASPPPPPGSAPSRRHWRARSPTPVPTRQPPARISSTPAPAFPRLPVNCSREPAAPAGQAAIYAPPMPAPARAVPRAADAPDG